MQKEAYAAYISVAAIPEPQNLRFIHLTSCQVGFVRSTVDVRRRLLRAAVVAIRPLEHQTLPVLLGEYADDRLDRHHQINATPPNRPPQVIISLPISRLRTAPSSG